MASEANGLQWSDLSHDERRIVRDAKADAVRGAEQNNGKFDGKLAEIRERHQRWLDRPAWVSLNEQAQFPKDVGVLLAEVDRLRGDFSISSNQPPTNQPEGSEEER